MDVLYGLHPVEEAIRAARQCAGPRQRGPGGPRRASGKAATGLPRGRHPRVSRAAGAAYPLCRDGVAPGVVGFIRERKFLTVEDLLAVHKPEGEHRFFLALDGVEDPHNLGALLRTADGAGADGVILPERRAAPVTATVAKTSAGASEHVRIARVTNLVRSLEQLKRENIWCIGLDERGDREYDQFDFNVDCVLVLGREGEGLHELTRKTCDHLLRIPMAGGVSSLNVSVAGAVVMYEAARQRRHPAAAAPVQQQKPVKPRKGLGS